MLFIQLPVRDLSAARTFYAALGLRTEDHSSDEETASIVLDDDVALIPPAAGPPVTYRTGEHRLEVVVDSDHPVQVTDLLRIAVAASGNHSPVGQ
jgi:catechol 2,3-dioxygenase-like lactoylglutathione lyase family enzyme